MQQDPNFQSDSKEEDEIGNQLTKKGEKLTDEEVKEYKQAFISREKITRSPPDNKMPTNRMI